METYGILIKRIRVEKGIKLKDLYDGIMSKSYSIRFEKGDHEISFYLIDQILARFPMEIDEFLYLFNQSHLSLTEWFYSEYGKKANNNDITGLQLLKKEYLKRDPHSSITKVRIAELSAKIEQLSYFNQFGVYSKDGISQKHLTIIKEHLSSIQTWTLDDLRFLANTLDFIEYEEKIDYFRLLLPALDKYLSFDRGRNIICILLINAIHQSVLSLEMNGVQLLLNKLLKFTQDISDMFYRNSYIFYKGLLDISEGKVINGKKSAKNAILVLQILGYAHQAELLEKSYLIFFQKFEKNNSI